MILCARVRHLGKEEATFLLVTVHHGLLQQQITQQISFKAPIEFACVMLSAWCAFLSYKLDKIDLPKKIVTQNMFNLRKGSNWEDIESKEQWLFDSFHFLYYTRLKFYFLMIMA